MATFTDGEPLDISKLNDMQNRIIKLEDAFQAFKTASSTATEAQIAITAQGTIDIAGASSTEIAKPVTMPNGIFSYIDKKTFPIVTATVVGKTKGNVSVSVSEVLSDDKFTVYVKSTAKEDPFVINWIAAQTKIIKLK